MPAALRNALSRCVSSLAVLLLSFDVAHQAAALEPHEAVFCDRQPINELCDHLPHDVPDFFASFVYRFLTEGAQDPFDVFSWQSFVAVNWPVDDTGAAVKHRIGAAPDRLRRWHFFPPSSLARERHATSNACGVAATSPPFAVVTDQFRQATGGVLIDSDLNFVVYDTRMNQTALRHIVGGAVVSDPVQFPDGFYADSIRQTGGATGSIFVKSAWRILDPASTGRYLTTAGRVAVAAEDSTDGRAHCHDLILGLVGMHIMRKVRSGNGSDWIWSTFEHVANAPLAANARDVNDVVTFNPFPSGCHPPSEAAHLYSFFTTDCLDCVTNLGAEDDAQWAPEPPFARAYAQGNGAGTQVVRCWQLFEGTKKINRIWQQKLAGTVFANYQLIGTQWRGNRGGPIGGFGEVPRYLTNTTLETFVQSASDGTCMGCHSTARTSAGAKSDFTFLLAGPQ